MDAAATGTRMLEVLQAIWGYPGFREPQEAVILNALSGNDSLVVMATGGGKSLCYQVPPLVSGTICLVVSPLIALMQDQVAALTARGVKAAMLGSAQTSAEVKRRAWEGDFQLLYVTPELVTSNISSLQQLHAAHRIGLIAVDEAHCVSEWGHDFRPSFRQLHLLRESLPDVPLMAVTATATQRVRQDIISELGLGRRGGPALRQWVMGFTRTNLHLSVVMKNGTGAAANLSALVSEAHQLQVRGQVLEPTLIYTQTTREVDELAAHLQAKGVAAVKYHAKLPVTERHAAHRAFLRDDATVMVASLAFGMGIDKPNIRRIIHFGIPGSLESYYQQAGRAGRDGLPAKCCLMWTPQDFNVQDLIKGASQLTGWNLESHTRGMTALRSYTSSGDCRHACLVNFFQPGALPAAGPCAGGCDNCSRRQEAAAAASAAAAAGTQVAPGAAAGQTDVAEQALLLLATVKGLKSFGLNRAVSVLRGSKAKGVEQWMQQLRGPDGNLLHGAGSSRSEEWWKGLAGVLMGQGYLQSQSKTNAMGTTYSVYAVTPKAYQVLGQQPPQPMLVMLPLHMEREENKQRLREAAERQRFTARLAAQQQRDEAAAEREQLLYQLKEARKATADVLQQAPDVLVNDFTLNQLLELRPTSQDELRLVSGFGQEALKHFSAPLLQVLNSFYCSSRHLKPTTNWVALRSSRAAAAAAATLAGTQHNTQAQAAATAGAGGGGAGSSHQQQTQAQAQHLGAACFVDQEVYEGFLDSKVLSEPKAAAAAALERWTAGESVEGIAENRDKPIQVGTVLGYLSEALAAAGALPAGCPRQQVQQLQQAAGLAGSAAAEAQLWRVVAVVSSQRGAALGALKKLLPEEVSYGHIKVAAALLALQAVPGLSGSSSGPVAMSGSQGIAAAAATAAAPGAGAGGGDEEVDLPVVAVQRSPALDRLLQLPGSHARVLYARWRAGVPLAVLGCLDGLNMQLHQVLGTLAEVAAAGYPCDLQQLAAAAELQEQSALAVAAAIRRHGLEGAHAVKSALSGKLTDLSYGQIKVVAALMATQQLWFAPQQQQQQQQNAVVERSAAGNPAAGSGHSHSHSIALQQELKVQQEVRAVDAAAASAWRMAKGATAAAAAVTVAGEAVSAARGSQTAAAEAAVAVTPQHDQQHQQQQQQQRQQQPALTDASNLPQAAPGATALTGFAKAATATAAAADSHMLLEQVDADDDEEEEEEAAAAEAVVAAATVAAAAAAAAAPPKRMRPGFMMGGLKSGKRRKPTSVAPPAPAPPAPAPPAAAALAPAALAPTVAGGAAGPAAGQAVPAYYQLQSNNIGSSMASPAPVSTPAAARAGVAAAAAAAGAAGHVITQEAVLKLLWDDTATAPELLQKLGVSGQPDAELALQQVLQELVDSGDQVCTTPAAGSNGAKIDVRNATVRFIAF